MRTTSFGRTPMFIAGGATVGLLALGGAGLAIAADGGGPAPESGYGSVTPAADGAGDGKGGQDAQGGGAPEVGLLKAAGIAAEEVPGGVVYDIELDDGTWEVELVVADGKRDYDVRVDAGTGEASADRDGRADAEDLQVLDAKVGLAEAHKTAERELGGTAPTEAGFDGRDDDRDDDGDDDREDRVAHWTFEGGDNRGGGDDSDGDGDDAETAVDAKSGKVIGTDDD